MPVQAAELALAECSRPVDGKPCEVCLPRAERTLRDLAAVGMVVVRAEDAPVTTAQTAPGSTETAERADPRISGSTDVRNAPEAPTALREPIADAIRDSAVPGLTVQGATDAVMAVLRSHTLQQAEAAVARVRDRMLTLEAWAHREVSGDQRSLHHVLSVINDLRVALDVPADGVVTPTTEETDHA
ncbi:hypothetical protein AB0B89_23715 [Sphaerisporangium sp. NPDC049002]|uniref:hypothetical protein n=1 Tax=Sphaerisporangium sp. NPDC049002 TaxID=3155392 RepID=UPI0033D55A0D